MSDLEQAAYFFFGLLALALGIKNIATGGPTLIGPDRNQKAAIRKLYRPIGAFQIVLGVASIWYSLAG